MPTIEVNPTADIVVQYINDVKPGKKLGNVKDDRGNTWFVTPAMLSQFSRGMTCKIEYEAGSFQDGKPFNKVKKIVGNGSAPVVPKNDYRARSNPAEAKQIAVLAIVKEWVPRIPVGDTAALIHAIDAAMKAYDMTLGGMQAQRRDDMDDEIPH